MALQVLRGAISLEHRFEWCLDLDGEDPRFTLRCRECHREVAHAGFTWIGNDGPSLGSVIRELRRRDREYAPTDEICPTLESRAREPEAASPTKSADS